MRKLLLSISMAAVLVVGLAGAGLPGCKLLPPSACLHPPTEIIAATYAFTVEDDYLTMPDGVRLAVTYYKPVATSADERFPIVLEMLPYRKDDDFYAGDYELDTYFPKRGIAIARVDVRGTGSSEGQLVDREYSDAELDDIQHVLTLLAALPWANGNVGMQGISWSGFNAIMTAMRRPPELKAILTAHASDDLYGNDVHYIDGGLHLDMYSLEMEVENFVPRSPDYPVDEAYFADRFEREPWLYTYLRHQRDGEFWQAGRSLQTDWSSINVPVYAIGGLLDGYRDTVPHMLDHLSVPVHAEIGPWNHAYPDYGSPKPDYEWRDTSVRWWRHWLQGVPEPFLDETSLTVFMRDTVPPYADLEQTPGSFWIEGWPVWRARTLRFYPRADASLREGPGAPATHELAYKPSAGIAVGNWWGETTGDMSSADENALVYDSPALIERIHMMGIAQVALRVSANAPMADWCARIEDVHPNGTVSLVTGGLINGAQRESRTNPEALVPGEYYTLQFPLRFTTYTFAPGHRIRFVVSNALFPMIWPTPYAMSTTLQTGTCQSYVDIPTVGLGLNATLPGPIQESDERPDVESLWHDGLQPFTILNDDPAGTTTVATSEASAQRIRDRLFEYHNRIRYSVDNTNPALASFRGTGLERIRFEGGRSLRMDVSVRIESDAEVFHTRITRRIFEDDALLREKTWDEDIPRDFQ